MNNSKSMLIYEKLYFLHLNVDMGNNIRPTII